MHPYGRSPLPPSGVPWVQSLVALIASAAALVLDVIRRDQNREEARKRRHAWRRRRAERRRQTHL